ncbi:NAD-dependent epimerase/dehydratase family protein [Nisaea sediminum]|uniref:NAD-dependent epimerase/dehydratase family protein n=1 Tax=Nisaea sediminum TaxID=2775867 RepID=UPI001866C082|nr:SDR family oxidoreductase [Nisaea sediminum]
MKVLVLGNLGYIGPVVVDELGSRHPDMEIVGFDTGLFKECVVDPEHDFGARLDHQIFGDVRDLTAELFSGVDAAIYLSALSNDPIGNAFEALTDEINAGSAVRAAEAAKAAGVKHFVFASSCSVYGAGGEEAKTEESSLAPQTAYARSKIAAEKALASMADDSFVITCLRFATACGFSPHLRLDLVLNDFVATALSHRKIDVLSDGRPWRPLIHVKDMARAMEWALQRSSAQGGAFLAMNTGADTANYQIRDLAAAVARNLGDVAVAINENASPDTRSYRVDFGLFRKLAPAHQPRMMLQDMVGDLVGNLNRIGFKDPDFRSGNLIRLNYIKDLVAKGALDGTLRWQ